MDTESRNHFMLLTYWPSQGWVKSDKSQMSFVWQQPKKEQVLRGENKVKFVHVTIPWPLSHVSAHPSLCPGPVPSFFPSHCQKLAS